MASQNVYTMKEFMEIISIQEQTCFQKLRCDQSRRQKQREEVDDDEHPLVTEMFGELYFRESPKSTLEGLFSPPAIGSPEPPAADPPADERPAEETKAAIDDDSDDCGDGKDQSSPAPN